jgi:peptidoglycan-associated lipoprotein
MKRVLLLVLVAVIAAAGCAKKGVKRGADDKAAIEDRSGLPPDTTIGTEGDLQQPGGGDIAQTTPAGGAVAPVQPAEPIGGAGSDGSLGSGAGAAGSPGAPGAGGYPPGSLAGAAGLAALKDPNSPLSKRSIYFAYDSFVVEEPYRAIVEAHSRMLLDNPNMRIMLQGNTDERGSREYNLALGQRRADAVRKMMGVLGVPDRQIETVSFGEEKPRSVGHNEDAWRENRRADIVYSNEQ